MCRVLRFFSLCSEVLPKNQSHNGRICGFLSYLIWQGIYGAVSSAPEPSTPTLGWLKPSLSVLMTTVGTLSLNVCVCVCVCFPGVSVVKNLSAMPEMWVRSLGQKDSPGVGNGYPLQYSGESHGQRRLESPWGHEESDTI